MANAKIVSIVDAEDLVDALYEEIARQNAEIELLQAEIAVYVRYILANDRVTHEQIH